MNDDRDHGADAVELANKLNAVCAGYSTASMYLAIGMMIGFGASQAERPNLPGLLDLIGQTAREEYDRRR